MGGASTISNSGFSGNRADNGGAIYTSTSLNLVGDNISGNRASLRGGGIYVRNGHTTLSQNTLVVGNFAGSKALRAVGAYVRQRDSIVSVFYLSNVEQYLRLQRSWNTFCANVATLPLDGASTFVRAGHGGRVARGTAMTAELGVIAAEVETCGGR